MKKTLLVLLSLLFCLCIFTACAHECEFATEWTSDATHHWHACSDAECAEVHGLASHTLVTKYNADYSKEYKECSVCGYKSAETAHAHTGGTATCTAKAVCTACNQSYGELASHVAASGATWQSNSEGHWKVCGGCDAKVESSAHTPATAVEENVVNATCNTAGSKDVVVYCSVCNYEISREEVAIPATGAHAAASGATWQSNSEGHWKVCGGCDAKVESSAHTPATAVEENVSNATCNTAGSKDVVVYCSVCNYEISREEVAILATGAHAAASNAAWLSDETNHWKVCGGIDCEEIVQQASHDYGTTHQCVCGRVQDGWVEAQKLVINQTNLSKVLYMTGAMAGYYGATSTSIDEGANIIVEQTTGGFYLYVLKADGSKSYISLVKDGNYNNFVFTDTATSVLFIDDATNSIQTILGEDTLFLGTNRQNSTFSWSYISYLTGNNAANQFPAYLSEKAIYCAGHTYGNWAESEGQHSHACTKCGYIESHSASYGSWSLIEGQHVQSCSCGLVNSHAPLAQSDDGDCTTDILCQHCSLVVTAGAQAHTPESTLSSDGTGHWHECSVCDKKADTVDSHTPSADDGNCTTEITCSACGYVTTVAQSHAYTGTPVWSSEGNAYTLTTNCDNRGCTVAPQTVVITVNAENATINHVTTDVERFSFSITPETGYYLVSVKIGENDVAVANDVYSADIAEATIVVTTSNLYNVKFLDVDGKTVLQEGDVAYGTVPTYTGVTLPQEIFLNFARYSLDENVWDNELVEVTGETTYKAKYNKIYAYEILAMRGDVVSNVAPAWAGANVALADSTRANVQVENADKYQVKLISDNADTVDYTKHTNIVFSFQVNYANMTIATLDGTTILVPTKDVAYTIIVDNAGKIYIRGALYDTLVEGATMTDGVVAFTVARNPATDTYAYLELTKISYDIEIVEPTAFKPIANGKIYDAATLEASPSSTPDLKDKTGLEIYSYTASGWQNTSFDDIDLMSYDEVKFYILSIGDNGSIKSDFDGGDLGHIGYLSDSWKEVHIIKNADGEGFTLYIDGVKIDHQFYESDKTTLKELTNLKQLTLNVGNNGGSFLISNLYVDQDHWVEPDPEPNPDATFVAVSGTIYNGATVVSSPTSTPTITETGLEIYSYTISKWGNESLKDFDLLKYDEVKFYVKRVSGGDIRTNSDGGSTGRFVDMNDLAWHEFHLVKNNDKTGFVVYIDGVKSSIKFYTDNNRTTEVPLTNMNQFALNGSSGEFLFSNLFVYDPNYIPPVAVDLTIGADGAISGQGVTGQTITLPTTKVWNLNEANAQSVTIVLSDASAKVGSLTINGVTLSSSQQVLINNVPYIVGAVDTSVAGQVTFKIGYIQDQFYFGDTTVNVKSLTNDSSTWTVGQTKDLTKKSDSQITTQKGIEAYHANPQKVDGVWCDNWRLTLNKHGADFSFYMTFNYSGAKLYAKDGIGDESKLIHTFTANEVVLVTILKDGSVLINGVDSGVDTSSENFTLDFYNGGSANAYGSLGISHYFWRDNGSY